MSPFEILRFAVGALIANRLRSILTMVGIAIGIAAVILLTAVGQGASAFIGTQLTGLGGNSITVLTRTPPRSSNITPRPLQPSDVDALSNPQGAPDIAAVVPVINTSPTTTAGAGSSSATLIASEPQYFAASNSKIATGRAFTQQDVDNDAKVVVIGSQVASDLFGAGNPIGQEVQFNNVPFQVIGELQSNGQGGPGGGGDSSAIAPLTTVQGSLTGFSYYSRIVVQSTTAQSQAAATAEIENILDRLHNTTDPNDRDYQVSSSAQLQTVISSTLSTFTLLLGAVGGISLLVGGLGITNIMLVSVTERTREIGIRKALGAPPSAILNQFLVESVILSLIGGVIGVGLGLCSQFIKVGNFQPIILPAAIYISVAISAVIGIFFGAYPARRASLLRPIEALRRE